MSITPTTIYDYEAFACREYPASPSARDVVGAREHVPMIDRSTPIASIGSCFARHVAKWLRRENYNYLVTETPFKNASAHWQQVYSPACLRQIFEYSLTDRFDPLQRWWPKGDHLQDPFRRDVLYRRGRAEARFAAHRRASRKALTRAEVVIITLGLVEVWRDRRDKATFYRVPSPRIYDESIHEFAVQSVGEVTEDLETICSLLAVHNPGADVILTVSPVPLFASFRMETDVISANRLSKATLRTAAEYVAEDRAQVRYFPSYEIVTGVLEDPYEEDGRHVREEAVEAVMQAFEELFTSNG